VLEGRKNGIGRGAPDRLNAACLDRVETRERPYDLGELPSQRVDKECRCIETVNEFAESRYVLDSFAEFRPGRARGDSNLTIKVSTEVREESFREWFQESRVWVIG